MQDRRTAKRYGMALPVRVDGNHSAPAEEPGGRTRDISTQGLYFTADSAPQPGTMVSLTLSLPATLTGGEGVQVEVLARVLRVEPAATSLDRRVGVAAQIVQYDILRASDWRPN